MTEEDKFLFDLEGYLIIKNVLSPDEVFELNEYIDRDNRIEDHKRPSLWGKPFKQLIDHPRIFPYLIEFIGPTVRLDHDYAIFRTADEKKLVLHGGPGRRELYYYRYHNSVIRNGMSVVSYCLSDVNDGDGGFTCIPGSHKTNLLDEIPEDIRNFERDVHYVVQPAAKAGDVILFTEALVHGTKPWRAKHQRRSLLYKYSPGYAAWNGNYPDISWYGELTERQKRLLQPPSIGGHLDVVDG